jgi:hypothetical protein
MKLPQAMSDRCPLRYIFLTPTCEPLLSPITPYFTVSEALENVVQVSTYFLRQVMLCREGRIMRDVLAICKVAIIEEGLRTIGDGVCEVHVSTMREESGEGSA